MDNPVKPSDSAVALLSSLLNQGWHLTVEDEDDMLTYHDREEIACRVKDTVATLSALIQEPVPQQVATALSDTLNRSGDSWFLFDGKGRPICPVPDKQTGIRLTNLLRQRHITICCYKRFEAQGMRQTHNWKQLQKLIDRPLFLKWYLAFYRLKESTKNRKLW